jgi:dihydropteroate synthase
MRRRLIVGVLNCTPDSFSDGGKYGSVEAAVEAGVRMAGEGADWIDVGGESTRPGSTPVPEQEEQARAIPVIEALRARLGSTIRISIDTYKAGTARAALAAGAGMVNDISGGRLDRRILDVAAEAGADVVLGHMRGVPATMMEGIAFTDVVREVGDELAASIQAARAAGCRDIWADPGIGFGKTLEHNIALIRALPALRERLGVPLLLGVSRKAFVGKLTGKPAGDRLFGTAAAVAAVVLGGADALRVHDFGAMCDVVRVAEALAAAV